MSDEEQATRYAPARAREMDDLARQLLALGWVVSATRPAQQEAGCLLVSRSAFTAEPAVVHVLAHHHLGLQVPGGRTVDVEDVEDLHRRLNGPTQADLVGHRHVPHQQASWVPPRGAAQR